MVIALKHYEQARLRNIAEMCPTGSILDIGYAHMPNPYFRNKTIVGLDLVQPLTNCSYSELIKGSAFELEKHVGGRTFDTIVIGEFIEHVKDPYNFLESLHKYLKPQGQLILSTPNPVSWPVVIFEWLNSKVRFYTKNHLFYFAPRWVIRMLTVSQYKVQKVKGVGLWLPFIKLPCPVGLSYQVIYTAKKDVK